MKKRDMIKFAVTGLKHRKARTFLTVLGVIIGTVCIILMVAVGFSGYRQFEENFLADQSLTEITVTDYSQGGGDPGQCDPFHGNRLPCEDCFAGD